MATFMIGKSLRDRRQHKAISELFDRADHNGNGRITVGDYVQIFKENGIPMDSEELSKVTALANEAGEVTKDEFLNYAKHSELLKAYLDKMDGGEGAASSPQASSSVKAERAFKLFDKDNNGYVSKEEFLQISRKLNREQINTVFAKFDKDGDGMLSFEEFKSLLNNQHQQHPKV